ncbi:MAG: HNH endonuclease, partial [Paludibacter sp.]
FSNNNYFYEIKSQILNESLSEYQQKILLIKSKIDSEEFQEEIYIRSNIFKKEVPKIYNYTCCISGLRIDVIDNISVIDACHIIPFSVGYNDSITNGIALCPNLHRAFDRGLITINEQFQVIVNNNFSEPTNSPYSIKQFDKKFINLPNDINFHPSIESLKHHMKRFQFL